MDGVTFDQASAARIARVVRRIERTPLNPEDDVRFGYIPPPVFCEVIVTGRAQTNSGTSSGVRALLDIPGSDTTTPNQPDAAAFALGSGSGDSGEPVQDCTIPLWEGTALVWNGCGWREDGDVWVFHLDDDILRAGHRYLTRVIESHFLRAKSDPTSMRPLCEVFTGLGPKKDIGSGSGSGSGSGEGCENGVPVNYCLPDGTSAPGCLTITGGQPVVIDPATGNVLGGSLE